MRFRMKGTTRNGQMGFGVADAMIGVSVATAMAGGTIALLRATTQQQKAMTLVNTLDQIENPIKRILNIDEDRFLLENTMLAADAPLAGLPASMAALRNCYKTPSAASCTIPATDFVLMSGRGGFNAGTATVQRFAALAGPRSGDWQVFYATSGAKCVTSSLPSATTCPAAQFPIQALASISVSWDATTSVGLATVNYCLIDRDNSIRGLGIPLGLTASNMPACVPFSSVGSGPRLRPTSSQYMALAFPLNFNFDCGTGQGVTSVGTRGEVTCGSIINRTTDSFGNPTTFACPQGQDFVGYKADGNADCRTDYSFVRDPCPVGQALRGFNPDGSKVCHNKVELAGTADSATLAEYAYSAGTAGHATTADSAVTAGTAGHATTADSAVTAGTAGHATTADSAVTAGTAGHATTAGKITGSQTCLNGKVLRGYNSSGDPLCTNVWAPDTSPANCSWQSIFSGASSGSGGSAESFCPNGTFFSGIKHWNDAAGTTGNIHDESFQIYCCNV